ncbi:MAG: DNA topoisomerase I [Verrucomicrobia bacterium]|nr:MAG: DNA topoisomerase I [Verrucomicrobiota bacterium]
MTNAEGSAEADKTTNALVAAQTVGLRYVSDKMPGIRRERTGKTFRFRYPIGKLVQEKPEVDRIKRLVIPPAWKDVWICPDYRGHLQATGRDDRGRKQYRYHSHWRQIRDETKFSRMVAFGKALPTIRKRVRHDLGLSGLPRDKVLATIVRLLDTTFIRVGNEEYARANKSFGLTTMRNRHVRVRGSIVHFQFQGKSGRKHELDVRDPRLARIVKRCQNLPGQELFQYLDEEGKQRVAASDDVNDYLRKISGQDFTAKDFRTWAGTVLIACALQEVQRLTSRSARRKSLVRAIESVAENLGNTVAVCRKCYIHPAIVEAYLKGAFPGVQAREREDIPSRVSGTFGNLRENGPDPSGPHSKTFDVSRRVRKPRQRPGVRSRSIGTDFPDRRVASFNRNRWRKGRLSAEEAGVLRFLQKRAAEDKRPLASQLQRSLSRVRRRKLVGA